MIKGWGAAASITFAVVAAVGVSGCGGDADTDAKKPAAASAKALSFSEASKAFQDIATTAYLDDVCTKEAGTCWDKMNTIADSARDLRKAMNAETSVGPVSSRLCAVSEGVLSWGVGADLDSHEELVR
ncbi:hypothetical protein [Streptomyces europaeiscabiei]|uniref:hypothetical protein n=1 Tax=Streptomyces europaeiscabiei TaxID=146819 RepID=UPI0029AE22DE|nr:hypothetical protein [Streptomyces europaeiscabiei]MDX2530838.1 hypothetical protein [Streptomyces europaeiscabiei]